jgi:hypothetical protein
MFPVGVWSSMVGVEKYRERTHKYLEWFGSLERNTLRPLL